MVRIKQFWKWLIRQYYRRKRYSSLYQSVYGKFYVLYPDGQKSMNMDYKTAKGYAELFNGKVIEDF